MPLWLRTGQDASLAITTPAQHLSELPSPAGLRVRWDDRPLGAPRRLRTLSTGPTLPSPTQGRSQELEIFSQLYQAVQLREGVVEGRCREVLHPAQWDSSWRFPGLGCFYPLNSSAALTRSTCSV